MTQQTSPFLEGKYGWALGESNWNLGMDENLVKFSYMFDRNVDGVVASLPAPVNGQAYFNTTDNRLYFAVGGSFYSSPTPKWIIFTDRATGNMYQFNGTSASLIQTPVQLDTRLDAVELTLTTLGTAAFVNVNTLTTQADLASSTVSLGAALVGRGVEGAESIKALLSVTTDKARHISVASYHTGWAATAEGPLGGSIWTWDSTEPKANHNGFNIISPTVPWSGAFATMDAFQAGTGETAPGTNGCWMRIYGENDLVSWGCLPVVGTNNHAAISRATAWSYTNKRKLKGNSGTFEFGSILDWSYPTFVFEGNGFRNTVLKFTGTGTAVNCIGTRPNNGAFSFDLDLSGFTVEGNSATADLIHIRINHCRLKDINLREASTVFGCGLNIEGVVLGHFENITCSTNTQLMTSRPLVGIKLNIDPTDSRRASANTFVNTVIEGMSADGIQLIAADQTTFIGGTSENNPGNGVTISTGGQINTFIGMGFENSGFADIFDGGVMNRFINCYTKKSLFIDTTSMFSKVEGGYHEKIETAVGAVSPEISHTKVKFFGGTGGIVTNANTTVSIKDVYDVALAAQVFPKKAASSITVGASPFTYTNNGAREESVVVTGGTVSQINYNRDGVAGVATLPNAGKFELLPGDGITITYTVAPTATKIPGGTNFM